jgi:hypothetical protein
MWVSPSSGSGCADDAREEIRTNRAGGSDGDGQIRRFPSGFASWKLPGDDDARIAIVYPENPGQALIECEPHAPDS